MKFNLNDFMQLDTKALLAVNGGTHCGGETGNYYGNSYSASSSSESWGGGSSYGGSHGSNGGGAGGGGCSRFDLSAFANKTGVNNRTETSTSVGGGGGSCSGKSESLKTCPTDKVTTYSDGRIQVSHKDGSHDFYYSDGRHIYYPSGKTEEIVRKILIKEQQLSMKVEWVSVVEVVVEKTIPLRLKTLQIHQ